MLTFRTNGRSLRVHVPQDEPRADFWAGVVAGLMNQYSHGGGWYWDYAHRHDEGSDSWTVQEKWQDGGAELAYALKSLALELKATRTEEFTREVELRIKEDQDRRRFQGR